LSPRFHSIDSEASLTVSVQQPAQAAARSGVMTSTMTWNKRLLDLLPALIVFASVTAFGTYVVIAYVLHDPWWLHTLAAHQHANAAHQPQQHPARRH
jgi:hypothetical protein